MAKFNRFLSENLGVSILGHAIVLVGIGFLADITFFDEPRMIAPDRIQITMIDLTEVKVTGDKTTLYNTNVPEKVEKPETKTSEKQNVPEPDASAQENIEKPTMVSEQKTEEPEKHKDKADNTPTPKKKTVVRVNRNVASLDRTLTVSVVDALRVAMTRCWAIDTARTDISNIRAVAHLTMRKNGTVSDVWFESAARAETDPAFAYVLETIRSAINVCQPLRMLPVGEYDKWKKIQLTFYPTTGAVM